MSDWKRSCLCLCRRDDLAGGGQCLHSENRQWSSVAEVNNTQAVQADLPILKLCQAALERRTSRSQAQVLILHDGMGYAHISQMDQTGGVAWEQMVEVCALDRIDHVDILLALALGFDRVVLQQLSAPDSAAIQSQQVELARAMGASGRVDLFATVHQLKEILIAVPGTLGHWRFNTPSIATNRRDTARACAAVLLPSAHAPVPLPADAPYGTVHLDEAACTLCHSCVWLCPTDALSIGERGSDLVFTESRCIQCGMCRSICPEDALQLDSRLVSLSSAETQVTLHQVVPACCRSCGKLLAEKSMIERLQAWIGKRRPARNSDGRQPLPQLCGACRAQDAHKTRRNQSLKTLWMQSAPRRGR